MRKSLLLSGALCGIALFVNAQGSQPVVIEKFTTMQMSSNGEWLLGRSNTWFNEEYDSYSYETSIYEVSSGKIYGTNDLFSITPYSRPISSTGLAVLSTYDESTDNLEMPYIVIPGQEPILLSQFHKKTGPYQNMECYSAAVSDGGNAFIGYYEKYPAQIPFICAINEDYTVGEPEFFPLPEKDIYGEKPFSVQLTCISDDCNTVAGTVICFNGNKAYPIVYSRNSGGEWEYSYPVEGFDNPENPESLPNFYELQVALSPDGTKMAATQAVPSGIANFDDYIVWVMDLKEGTATPLESSNPDVIATQILNDGTIVGTFFATINISYIYLPGADDFIDFMDYAYSVNPAYGEWMEDNLLVHVQDYDVNGNLVDLYLPDTGQIFVSDDLSVFGAGFQTNEYDEYYNMIRWSYLFQDISAGITAPSVSADNDGKINVFNLQGQKILTTKNNNDIRNLPSGLYIVNGKKVIIGN